MATLSGPNWTFSCDDMPDQCDWCKGGPCRFVAPDAPINVLRARIAELEGRYNEVKTQRDQLQRLVGDYKAIAEGREDLYRRARQ